MEDTELNHVDLVVEVEVLLVEVLVEVAERVIQSELLEDQSVQSEGKDI